MTEAVIATAVAWTCRLPACLLTASLASLVSVGADVPLTISLNSALTGATGLTQGGTAINWNYVNANQIDGIVGNNASAVVFSITQSGGNWLFTLKDNIDHDTDGNLLTGNGDAYSTTLSLADVFIASDSDNDSLIIGAGVSGQNAAFDFVVGPAQTLHRGGRPPPCN